MTTHPHRSRRTKTVRLTPAEIIVLRLALLLMQSTGRYEPAPIDELDAKLATQLVP